MAWPLLPGDVEVVDVLGIKARLTVCKVEVIFQPELLTVSQLENLLRSSKARNEQNHHQ